MKVFKLLAGLGAILTLSASILASPAQAQATRTWISGVGDDVNPCSRTAPCKTFAGAISKTAAGGEINCIDSGGFGALTITKAITLDCETVEAGVLVAGTNGIVVAAATTDVVVLRGLDFQGLGSGLNGVQFNSGAALYIEKCVIQGFIDSGVNFVPNQNGTAKLTISDTVIRQTGSATLSGGIVMQPQSATAPVVATIKNSSITGSYLGIKADSELGGNINASFYNTVTNQNSHAGIIAQAVPGGEGGTTSFMIDSATSSNNVYGIRADGPNATVRVSNSTVTNNSTVGLAGTDGGGLSPATEITTSTAT